MTEEDSEFIYDKKNAFLYSEAGIAIRKKAIMDWLASMHVKTTFACRFTTKPTTQQLRLILECTSELFDLVVNDTFGRKVSQDILQTLAIACYIISAKLMFAYDNIDDEDIVDFFYYQTGKGIDKKRLFLMEADVMRRTDWKGCSTFFLERHYEMEKSREKKTKEKKDFFLFSETDKAAKKSKVKKSVAKKGKEKKSKTKKSRTKKSKAKKSKTKKGC